jgi:hypothetical protein
MPEGDIFVIPVKIEPCKLEDRLSGIHSVDLFEASGFEKMIQSKNIKFKKMEKRSKVKTKTFSSQMISFNNLSREFINCH